MLLILTAAVVVLLASPTCATVNDMTVNKLRGSQNRWNYNEVYKAEVAGGGGVVGQKPSTRQPVELAFNRQAFEENSRRKRDGRLMSTAPPPTPGKHPEQEAKQDVDWAYDTLSFYLKASADMRFKIRHAPIPASGSPWPMPRTYLPTRTTFRVIPNDLRFRMVGGESCDILEKNFQRITANMFGDMAAGGYDGEADDEARKAAAGGGGGGRRSTIHWLNITVLKECTEFPYLEMDESYDLEVKPAGVSIIALEVWGAIRGMETFSQLVYEDVSTGMFFINKTFIRDFPRFRHRGVLLDTSRHYLDKDTIIANLEAMAQNKMNVFHWHIVDDQSFPYESKVFPNLSGKGAYNPVTHVYTHEDIAEIIEEGRLRGIRVIPEFDTPGHTFSWGYGQDHLLTPCYDYRDRPSGLYGPINPILRKTYTFLQKLFAEILNVFRDKYVHLGGDEVPFDCWYMNPTLKSFIRRNNLTDVRDLLNIYERKLLDIVTNLGEKRENGAGYIVWQEVFDNGVKVKPDTIVQVWSGDSYNIDRITRAGLRVLFSTCWYLDYINYGQDWDKYYNCEQIGMNPTDYKVNNESLLIGGEVCLWTEFADDDSIMPRIWPRASAAAERLWSDRSVNSARDAAPRIEEQRCRMMRRGLRVGVLSGPGHCARGTARRKTSHVMSGRSTVGGDRSKNKFVADKETIELRVVNFNSRFTAADNQFVAKMLYWCPLLLLVVSGAFVIIARYGPTTLASTYVTNIVQRRCGIRSLPKLLGVFTLFVLVWLLWSVPFWTYSNSSSEPTAYQ